MFFEVIWLVAGLLGVEAGQDAVLRTMLYEKGEEKVDPYGITVFEFTNMISRLRNELGKCGVKDKGLIVPLKHGAESRTTSNVLSAGPDSLSYSRTPKEIMRIMYGTGDEHRPGGFFSKGANGRITREYLNNDSLRMFDELTHILSNLVLVEAQKHEETTLVING